jgi:micrococcal nuclease
MGFRRRTRRSTVPASVLLPPRWRRNRPAIFVIIAVLAALFGERTLRRPGGEGSDLSRYHDQSFRVVKVVDGDTMDLDVPDVDHAATRVRLWGVDTPELAHGGQPEMYFGPEAREFARRTLDDRTVQVVLNPDRTRDKYGRLLAYLFLNKGGEMFNEKLVEEGFGYADWRFKHPYKDEFEAAERRARGDKVGMWKDVRKDQMPAWRQRMETKHPGSSD